MVFGYGVGNYQACSQAVALTPTDTGDLQQQRLRVLALTLIGIGDDQQRLRAVAPTPIDVGDSQQCLQVLALA